MREAPVGGLGRICDFGVFVHPVVFLQGLVATPRGPALRGQGEGCAALPADAPTQRGRLLLFYHAADEANRQADRAALATRIAGPEQPRRVAYRGAGYSWDFPQAERLASWRHAAQGLAVRVTVRGWPALTALSAAEVARFLAVMPAAGW